MASIARYAIHLTGATYGARHITWQQKTEARAHLTCQVGAAWCHSLLEGHVLAQSRSRPVLHAGCTAGGALHISWQNIPYITSSTQQMAKPAPPGPHSRETNPVNASAGVSSFMHGSTTLRLRLSRYRQSALPPGVNRHCIASSHSMTSKCTNVALCDRL